MQWRLDSVIVLSISHCRQSCTNSLFYLNTSKYFLSFSGSLLFSSVLNFFVVENIQNPQFFLEKLIGQWIPDRDGRRIATDNSLTNQFFQKNWRFYIFSTKKVQNWREEKGHFSFLNCPNFVTIFCQVSKMEIIFFDIPSNPPPITVKNSLTNQFFQKKLIFCIFSTTTKKLTSLYRDIHLGDSWPYVFILFTVDKNTLSGWKLGIFGKWIHLDIYPNFYFFLFYCKFFSSK